MRVRVLETLLRVLATTTLAGSVTAVATSPLGGPAFADSLTPTGGATYQVPADVPADCSVDVTARLVAWFATVPDGTAGSPNVLSFAAGGCYRVEGTVRVTKRNWLTFDGHGATFRATTKGKLGTTGNSVRSHWEVVAGTNLTLRNIRVEGTNTKTDLPTVCPQCGTYDPSHEFEHGFNILGVNGIYLENLAVDAVWGDGMQLFGGGKDAPDLARNVHVNGLTVSRNGRQGFTFDDVRGALVENVHILGSRRSGFDLEPPSTAFRVRDIEVRNSDVWAAGDAFAAAGAGIVNNVFLHNNTVSHGWFLQMGSDYRRSDWTVWDNVATNGGTGLIFKNVDNVDVRRNVIHSWDVSATSLQFINAGGVLTVVGNDFRWGCRSYGAYAGTGPVLAYDNRIGACTKQPMPDRLAPVVRLQDPTPADGSTVTGPVTVSALAGDGTWVASVSLAVDGVVRETIPALVGRNPFTFALPTTELLNGAHDIEVSATDTSANVGRSIIRLTVANPPVQP